MGQMPRERGKEEEGSLSGNRLPNRSVRRQRLAAFVGSEEEERGGEEATAFVW